MAEFVIKMADERGHVMEQVEHGTSESELRDRYSQQGFLIYSVKPRGLVTGGKLTLRPRKVRQDTFVVFNEQLLTLIHAGLPILGGLEMLQKRQRNAYFRTLLENVRDRVKSGELLSEAFAAQHIFPKIYTTTLLAGEKSGNLEEVLGRFVNFQRMGMTFRKKLLASLVYPALLIIMVIVMLTFLVTYVVPQFANLYEQLNANLPPMTQFMLEFGKGVQKYLWVVVIGILAAVILGWNWARSDAGAEQLDKLRLSLPLVGEIWLKYQVAIFSRMMSTLLSGGLPLVPALETAGASMQSRHIAHGISQAAQRVREGGPLSRSLEQTNTFPELAVEMIEVGESTGALPAMLNSVAEFFEEDVQTAITAAMSLIEPVILVGMGVIVAFVLISLYLPIFTLGAGGIR